MFPYCSFIAMFHISSLLMCASSLFTMCFYLFVICVYIPLLTVMYLLTGPLLLCAFYFLLLWLCSLEFFLFLPCALNTHALRLFWAMVFPAAPVHAWLVCGLRACQTHGRVGMGAPSKRGSKGHWSDNDFIGSLRQLHGVQACNVIKLPGS